VYGCSSQRLIIIVAELDIAGMTKVMSQLEGQFEDFEVMDSVMLQAMDSVCVTANCHLARQSSYEMMTGYE
jgi:hypothetical protein